MATIFQAEVYAIGHSANYVKRHAEQLKEKGIRHIDIITDSRAALLALDSYVFVSKLVKDSRNLQRHFSLPGLLPPSSLPGPRAEGK
jgi:hypothetical protein